MKEKNTKKKCDNSNNNLSRCENSLARGYDNSICTDPNGSYTGVPRDKDEKPVQDVDDL